MPLEIERRFLITEVDVKKILETSLDGVMIEQVYLPSNNGLGVRARRCDRGGETSCLLTVKRTVAHSVNEEHEVSIPLEMFEALSTGADRKITKVRYPIPHDDLVIELDWFPDTGLFIAEVELPAVDHPLRMPKWFGEEITGRKEFSNYAMASPFEQI